MKKITILVAIIVAIMAISAFLVTIIVEDSLNRADEVIREADMIIERATTDADSDVYIIPTSRVSSDNYGDMGTVGRTEDAQGSEETEEVMYEEDYPDIGGGDWSYDIDLNDVAKAREDSIQNTAILEEEADGDYTITDSYYDDSVCDNSGSEFEVKEAEYGDGTWYDSGYECTDILCDICDVFGGDSYIESDEVDIYTLAWNLYGMDEYTTTGALKIISYEGNEFDWHLNYCCACATIVNWSNKGYGDIYESFGGNDPRYRYWNFEDVYIKDSAIDIFREALLNTDWRCIEVNGLCNENGEYWTGRSIDSAWYSVWFDGMWYGVWE